MRHLARQSGLASWIRGLWPPDRLSLGCLGRIPDRGCTRVAATDHGPRRFSMRGERGKARKRVTDEHVDRRLAVGRIGKHRRLQRSRHVAGPMRKRSNDPASKRRQRTRRRRPRRSALVRRPLDRLHGAPSLPGDQRRNIRGHRPYAVTQAGWGHKGQPLRPPGCDHDPRGQRARSTGLGTGGPSLGAGGLPNDLTHVRRVKQGSPSTHPILGDELRALRRRQREQDPRSPFVFTSDRVAPFTNAGFARMLERAARLTKLPFKPHPHMLRHACGFALSLDVPVQALLVGGQSFEQQNRRLAAALEIRTQR
jgi:Phage integrase family